MDQEPTRPPDRSQPPWPPQPPADEGPVWDPPPPPPGAAGTYPPAGTVAGPPAEPPRRRRRGALIAGVVAGVVAVAAAVGAFLFFRLAGTGDVLIRMVPSSSDAYVTAFLDPGAGQKVQLGELVRKFPALREQLDRGLDTILDEALAGTGLSFTQDVKPWLGSQISFSIDAEAGREPAATALVATDDEGAATAALQRAEAGPFGAGFQFRTQEHNGVSIRVGEAQGAPELLSAPPRAYAVFDGVVVVAQGRDALGAVKSVIDTAQGRTPSLETDANFQATLDALPDTSLGFAYLNPQVFIEQFLGIGGTAGADPSTAQALQPVRALRGMGVSLSAADQGLLLSVGVVADLQQLPPEQRAILQFAAHENSTLAFAPQDSYGLVALQGLDLALPPLLEPGGLPADIELAFQRFGVRDVLGSLNGDLAIEIGPGPEEAPAGALLIGTDDPAGMQAFLDGLLDSLIEESQGQAQKQTQEHRGATITSLPVPDLAASGIAPSFAVVEGMAILATSPDEVKQAIDAQADGTSIASNDRFSRTVTPVGDQSVALLYADLRSILALLPPGSGFGIDSEARRNIEPITATAISWSSSPEGVATLRWFILVE